MSLHKAVVKGDVLEVRRLVESGVEVNGRDAGGRTALMLCCLHDGEDRARGVARTLLMHGGRVGLSDGSGHSALIYAFLYERVGLVQMFLQALDYDLIARDRTGRTALDYANQTRNQTIIELVLQVMRRYGLTSQNSCSQNPQPTDQRIQEPQEPQHQPSTKDLLKIEDSKTEVPSVEESSPPVQNPKPGQYGVFTNPRPYETLSKTLRTIKENIHQRKQNPKPGPNGVFTNPLPYKTLSEKKLMNQETVERTQGPRKHQGPQMVSKTISSKVETKSGEESSPPVQNPEQGQYGLFANPLPYKTLSEKKRMSQETLERTQGPKRQPDSKDAPKKDYSKKETEGEKKGEESSHPIRSPKLDPDGVFTNSLPYKTLSKKLWTIQENIHQRKHQGPQTVSKSTSSKMETKSENKGEESSSPGQNPKSGSNTLFTNPLPYKNLSEKKRMSQETIRRTQGPKQQPASKDAPKKDYSKTETRSGEERSPPVQNPKPGQYGVFTNPLPCETFSEKKRMSQETIRRTQGPKRQPASKDAPNKAVFTNHLPYRTLSKKLWTSQETVQRTLGVQHQPNPKLMFKAQGFPHIQNPEPGQETVKRKLEPQQQPASRGASKVTSKVAFKVVLDESSPPVQNPLPLKTTSKSINQESLQRNLESKDLQRSVKGNEKTTHGRSPPLTPRNWRLDFRVLMETLQVQNSPSYRPKAQPRPPAPRRRRRRFPGAERSLVLGRKKSRKMSLGALDESLGVEKMMRTYRRRCTLAAIPVIQPTEGRSTRVTGQENFRVGGERKPSKTAGEIKFSKKK